MLRRSDVNPTGEGWGGGEGNDAKTRVDAFPLRPCDSFSFPPSLTPEGALFLLSWDILSSGKDKRAQLPISGPEGLKATSHVFPSRVCPPPRARICVKGAKKGIRIK